MTAAVDRRGGVLAYTPSREAGATLDARTVGRDDLLKVLASRFATAARSKNRIHSLLVGPRGSGKSHVVEVALHRMRQDETLRDRFAVVGVPEDGLGITRFSDIVDLVWRELGGGTGGTRRQASHWSQVTDLLGGRVLLLVVENLDRLFDALGEAGQRDLRSWVETSGEVLLLTTTPLLTRAVTSRDEPWFGGFAVEEVVGLTAQEGGELLRRIAIERRDTRLEEFLASPAGQARVLSVAQLAGGSARVWTILADCVSAESLDDLVLAVQDLLEGLVPYYQQLVWGLAPNEQRIVRVLAEGPYGALSVGEIAQHAGLEERTTASTLGRLKASRWVASEKPGVGDARRVLYHLREPMLRHHVQYRSGDRSTLLLIVELLRSWFDRSERTARLADAPAGSMTMAHLAASFRSSTGAYSSGLDAFDLPSLQALARRWTSGEDAKTWGCAVGSALDDILSAYCDSRRASDESAEVGFTPQLADWIRGEARKTDGRVAVALSLVAGIVRGLTQPGEARTELGDLSRDLPTEDHLAWRIRMFNAHFARVAGDHEDAVALWLQLAAGTEEALGPDHPDTLASRNNLAWAYADAGRLDEAITLFQATLTDRERLLGPNHPDTLWSRIGLADALRREGNAALALEMAAEVSADLSDRHDSERQRGWARYLLDACMAEVVNGAGEAPEDGIAGLFAQALRGDAEALVRLPTELRDLVSNTVRPTGEPPRRRRRRPEPDR